MISPDFVFLTRNTHALKIGPQNSKSCFDSSPVAFEFPCFSDIHGSLGTG